MSLIDRERRRASRARCTAGTPGPSGGAVLVGEVGCWDICQRVPFCWPDAIFEPAAIDRKRLRAPDSASGGARIASEP